MKRVWLLLYQGVFLLFGAVYLSLRWIRGRSVAGIRERLAFYPAGLRERLSSLRGPIWVHLVSVGEVMAARPLIEELRRRFPQRGWVVTTTTPTGREVALKNLQKARTQVLYLPWDLGPAVRRAVRAIRPALFLSFETELWPVLFARLGASGVPIAVINGRISPRAYGRYLWIRPLMRMALEPVGLFLTQSPQDARRYAALGAAKDRLVVTGNLKWDFSADPGNGSEPERLRALIGLGKAQRLWAAGSTHPGEEGMILKAYKRLKAAYPELRLLVAPRHPNRVPEVEREAQREGIQIVRRSRLGIANASNSASLRGAGPRDDVILLDTVGELTSFYAISDLVFVGGSLVPHGGHNLAEPAALSRPILAGPHLQNFQAISESLRQAKGMVMVRTPEDLEQAAGRLLRDPAQGREMGSRANRVFQENQGAVKRTADLISLRWGKELR